MENIFTISFRQAVTRFRRFRFGLYRLALPRGCALRMQRWETRRLFDGLIAKAKGREEQESLIQESYYEISPYNEQLAVHYSSKWLEQAQRLMVPHPTVVGGEDDPNWSRDRLSGGYYLSPEGLQKVRTAVREEQKQRREVAAFWIGLIGGTLIGVLGALTGVLATLKD